MFDFTLVLAVVVLIAAGILGLGIAYLARLLGLPAPLRRGMAIAYGATVPAAAVASLTSFVLTAAGERSASSAIGLVLLHLAFAIPAVVLLAVFFRIRLRLNWGLAAFGGLVALLCIPGLMIAGGVASAALLLLQ